MEEIHPALRDGLDEDTIARVSSYERAHKNRAGVLEEVRADRHAAA